MKLLIVESPTKAKTIESYLKNDFKVLSTRGTLRDLAKRGVGAFGVDLKNDFNPIYVVEPEKETILKELKRAAKHASDILIATDPDREGEAIAWHIADLLSLPTDKENRVVFHEITKQQIIKQLDNPRKIDLNLVHSQETRRIIDRIIGFRLSVLAKSKIGGKSAGRVQTVALKLICDLEDLINNFVPTKYYEIILYAPKNDNFSPKDQTSYLFSGTYQNVKAIDIDEQLRNKIISEATNPFTVTDIKTRVVETKSKPPFITSTIQQEAFNHFGYPAKKTMSVLQSLFEGVMINGEQVGLITYMRTDSKRLSPEFLAQAKDYVTTNFGSEYVTDYTLQSSKVKIQDAHEAIRPTSLAFDPKTIKAYLDTPSFNLYRLIYERSIQTVIKPSLTEVTDVIISSNGHHFVVTGKKNIFQGCLVYSPVKDTVIPSFTPGEVFSNLKLIDTFKETKPPARYTEASLIKKLEELGIGRPSTYATTMQSIKNRDYATISDKHFLPTALGIKTVAKLNEFFNDIINVKYTSTLEHSLDEISLANINYKTYLHEFYDNFNSLYEIARVKMDNSKVTQTNKICPECGAKLVRRLGRYGEFVSCGAYPKCKYIEQDEPEEVKLCPKCGSNLVTRIGRYGKFTACSNYPDCDYNVNNNILDKVCPECGKPLIKRRGRFGEFIACTGYPSCKYIERARRKSKETEE